MENKQKIVKKITKAVIFCLCCVLVVGSVSIPTFAVIDDNGYSTDGFTVTVDGLISSSRVFDDWQLRHNNSPSLTGIMTWYVEDESQPPLYYTFEVPAVNYGSTYFIEFIIPQGYRMDGINVNHVFNGNITSETVVLDDVNGVPTFNITINKTYDVNITMTRDEDTSLPSITMQGFITIADTSDDPIAPSPDYSLGYEAGYGIGYSDGYIEGLKAGNTSFVELLFKPIQAMHSVVLFDINGTQAGGEISIGGIFGTVVSIMLLVAFLRYFAGG